MLSQQVQKELLHYLITLLAWTNSRKKNTYNITQSFYSNRRDRFRAWRMTAGNLLWRRDTWTTIWKRTFKKNSSDAHSKVATRRIPGSLGLTYISRLTWARRNMCVRNWTADAPSMKKVISRLTWGFTLERNLITATSHGVWSLFLPRATSMIILKNIKKVRYGGRPLVHLWSQPNMLNRQVMLPLLVNNKKKRLMKL